MSRHLWFLELVLPTWTLLLTLGTTDMEKEHCEALISDIHLSQRCTEMGVQNTWWQSHLEVDDVNVMFALFSLHL